MKCDRPTRESFAWPCRVQTDFRVISGVVSALELAERVGFEPTLPFRVNTLSKRAPSATRPSLRLVCCDGKPGLQKESDRRFAAIFPSDSMAHRREPQPAPERSNRPCWNCTCAGKRRRYLELEQERIYLRTSNGSSASRIDQITGEGLGNLTVGCRGSCRLRFR